MFCSKSPLHEGDKRRIDWIVGSLWRMCVWCCWAVHWQAFLLFCPLSLYEWWQKPWRKMNSHTPFTLLFWWKSGCLLCSLMDLSISCSVLHSSSFLFVSIHVWTLWMDSDSPPADHLPTLCRRAVLSPTRSLKSVRVVELKSGWVTFHTLLSKAHLLSTEAQTSGSLCRSFLFMLLSASAHTWRVCKLVVK